MIINTLSILDFSLLETDKCWIKTGSAEFFYWLELFAFDHSKLQEFLLNA